MTRSKRARREAARERARRKPLTPTTDTTDADAADSASATPATAAPRSSRRIAPPTKARPARPWYQRPAFQQGVFLTVATLAVVGVVWWLYTQQQIAANPPTPTPFAAIATPIVTTPTPNLTPAAPTPTAPRQFASAPPLTINTAAQYTATMETSRGTIVLSLDPRIAPLSVNNFVFLARQGFYDGLTFHRVEDWVIQGGDPLGTGTGGPGYSFPDERVQGEYVRGVLAMANSGPNTNGSQFFIMKRDTPLQPQYNLFGRVVTGLDVVDQIQRGDRITRVAITQG